MKREITIEGMSCEHCVKAATNALSSIEGVSDVKVDLDSKKAVFEADDTVTDAALSEVLEEEGFTMA